MIARGSCGERTVRDAFHPPRKEMFCRNYSMEKEYCKKHRSESSAAECVGTVARTNAIIANVNVLFGLQTSTSDTKPSRSLFAAAAADCREQIAVHMLLIELCRAPIAHCLQSQTVFPSLTFILDCHLPAHAEGTTTKPPPPSRKQQKT